MSDKGISGENLWGARADSTRGVNKGGETNPRDVGQHKHEISA